MGPYAVPVDPDVEDSHTRLEATFECIAPPLCDATALTEEEMEHALDLLRRSKLMLRHGQATGTVGETVASFLGNPNLTEKDGWRMREALPGVVEVSFSFWNGPGKEAQAIWHVIPSSDAVRYRNRYAKQMSGTTTPDGSSTSQGYWRSITECRSACDPHPGSQTSAGS